MLAITEKIKWKILHYADALMAIHLHVQFRIMSVRIVPGKTTTNSSLASRQQKSISSLMSFRQDRSSFTCSKPMKLHTHITKCHCAFPHLTECVVLTDHYKHGTLRSAGASGAADSLQLLPAYNPQIGFRLLRFSYTRVFLWWFIHYPWKKREWHGSFWHLDKSWRIRGDVKVTLDAVHYLKGEKND